MDSAIISEAAQWRDTARALRAQQDMIAADAAITRAQALAPADRLIAFLQAQSRYELGHPAAALFARVVAMWPDNLDALRNGALAHAAEGHPDRAIALLTRALAARPLWLDGHRVLASLRWTQGDGAFDSVLADAARAHPAQAGLWLGWFTLIAQHRDWPRARAILAEAARHLGQSKGLLAARLFVASETGDMVETAGLLARTAHMQDDFLAIARIRWALRQGDPAQALAIALPLTAGPLANGPLAGQMWPYVATCWRLLDDPRSCWLHGDVVRVCDVDLSPAEMADLADLLRGLHGARLPYAEQSVRGGTQTDRSVLLRHEPLIQRTRAALMTAVRAYVDALPLPDAAHPLLSHPRGDLRIAGSWSVRLGGGGFNVTHAHPLGWISSAFYVAVPPVAIMGPAPAGHLHLGVPPPELGLDLPPVASVAPVAGRLVLFPSTLWHGTVPTQGGERLNIAFDIVPG